MLCHRVRPGPIRRDGGGQRLHRRPARRGGVSSVGVHGPQMSDSSMHRTRNAISPSPRATFPALPDAERGAEAVARWKLRHGLPDALARWREAGPGRGGPFAFAAIVQDPFALTRMRLSVASLLAQDAVDHADQLAASLRPEAQSPSPAAAAVVQVRGVVTGWRQSLERRPRNELFRPRRQPDAERRMDPGAAPGPSSFDRFDEGQGQVATDAVARLGATGLPQVAFREARVLAGSVTRFVGGALLSAERVPAAWGPIRRALLALQGHAAAVGASLFLTEDYRSATLPPGAVAARLSADLAVCGAAVRTVEGGAQAPGFPMWAAAEEVQALAALALDPKSPASLPPGAAARLVRAAQRRASGRRASAPDAAPRAAEPSVPGAAGGTSAR